MSASPTGAIVERVVDVATTPATDVVTTAADVLLSADDRPVRGFDPSRGLLPLPPLREPAWQRYGGLALALLLTFGFALICYSFFVPAHPGVDQNGYLVGGRKVAQTLTMKNAPVLLGTEEFDPHQFVGRMWVGADYATPAERYYPKYPIGLPLLYAISLWIGGPEHGPVIAYMVSPIAMTLAVLGTFFLARRVAGTFAALLATITVAASPVITQLAVNPNSHAATVFCVVWGMVMLMRWWQQGGWFTGLCAGLLLGYAVTIRYTEGTLVLAIAWVIAWRLWGADRRFFVVAVHLAGIALGAVLSGIALFKSEPGTGKQILLATGIVLFLASIAGTIFHARRLVDEGINRARLKLWRDASLVVIGWLIPVVGLVSYNYISMGTITGYDQTNESIGFRWTFFWDNWETTIRQLGVNGLSLMFPLAVVGMVVLFFWNASIAIWLSLWIVPCILIYSFYYWAPDSWAIGYLRFYATILPALAVAGVWLMVRIGRVAVRVGAETEPRWRAWKVGVVLGVIVIATIATDFAVRTGVNPLEIMPRDAYFEDDHLASNAWRIDKYGGHYAMMLGVGLGLGALAAAIFAGRRAAVPVAAGLVVLLTGTTQLATTLPIMESEHYTKSVLDENATRLTQTVPDGAVLYCTDESMLHHVQFLRDYEFYLGQTFNRGFVQGQNPARNTDGPTDPNVYDPGRRKAIFERLGSLSQEQLNEQARRIVDNAFANNRRVFFAMPRNEREARRPARPNRQGGIPDPWKQYWPEARYEIVEVEAWLLKPPFDTSRHGATRADRNPRRGARPVAWVVYELKPKAS